MDEKAVKNTRPISLLMLLPENLKNIKCEYKKCTRPTHLSNSMLSFRTALSRGAPFASPSSSNRCRIHHESPRASSSPRHRAFYRSQADRSRTARNCENVRNKYPSRRPRNLRTRKHFLDRTKTRSIEGTKMTGETHLHLSCVPIGKHFSRRNMSILKFTAADSGYRSQYLN
jgi:hypothetical protein